MGSTATTIRTFRNRADAENFYNNVSPYARDDAYASYVSGGGNGGSPGGGSAGNMTGAPPLSGTYSPSAGGVPQVPDLAKTQLDAIQGNLSNLGALYGLGDQLNTWSNAQAKKALEQNLPGYAANMEKWGLNNADLLAGKISPETIANMAIAGAERGISVGSGGPNANAAYLRALGLTTEGLKAQGAQQFAAQIAATPLGKQFDWAAFLTLPSEQQQWQYLANVLKAAPNPAAAQANNMNMALLGQLMGQNGMFGGGNRGGGSYGGGISYGGGAPANTSQSLTTAQDIINRYMPTTGATAPANTTPGWGETWTNLPNGGRTFYGSTGNMPSNAVTKNDPFAGQYWNDPFLQLGGSPGNADIPTNMSEYGEISNPLPYGPSSGTSVTSRGASGSWTPDYLDASTYFNPIRNAFDTGVGYLGNALDTGLDYVADMRDWLGW